jgi:hypothetical protein
MKNMDEKEKDVMGADLFNKGQGTCILGTICGNTNWNMFCNLNKVLKWYDILSFGIECSLETVLSIPPLIPAGFRGIRWNPGIPAELTGLWPEFCPFHI